MKSFLQEIVADIEWRISELATIKTIPIRYSFDPHHKEVHFKYAVPAIYAIWEGFIKSCFTIYSNHINTHQIKRSEIALPLLTHQLDSECGLENPRNNFGTKQKLVDLINNILTDIIIIKPSIPTESNVNYKVLNKILERFCVQPVSEEYEKGLNKLLRFRNMIAHGENSVSVDSTHIQEFVSLIENLMFDITIHLESSDKNATYKKRITDTQYSTE